MISPARVALALCAASSILGFGATRAATPPAPAKPAAAAADDENDTEQKTRREEYIKKAFERFDTNKDGKIDADEFRVGLERYLDRQKAAFNRDFDDADANHDGKLSRAEVRKANPTLFQHFDDIDTNKDGFLSKAELRAAIREHQMRASIEGDHDDDAQPAATPAKP